MKDLPHVQQFTDLELGYDTTKRKVAVFWNLNYIVFFSFQNDYFFFVRSS